MCLGRSCGELDHGTVLLTLSLHLLVTMGLRGKLVQTDASPPTKQSHNAIRYNTDPVLTEMINTLFLRAKL